MNAKEFIKQKADEGNPFSEPSNHIIHLPFIFYDTVAKIMEEYAEKVQATPKIILPMTIILKKDEFDRGDFSGQTYKKGNLDFLYGYCKKKKIPYDEPKNKEGFYDRVVIKLETIEQALNLLLWEKFKCLSKINTENNI